jgi:seryl-tRNA synthetase
LDLDFPSKKPSHAHDDSKEVLNPKEAYSKVRERMLELEIERDEQQKALELLKEVRQRERKEMEAAIAEAKEEGAQYADLVKSEMASRLEKQV